MRFGLLLCLVVISTACTKNAGEKPLDLRAVRVQSVAPAAAAAGNRYSAQVLAAARVDAAFRIGGYVDEVAPVKGADGRPRLLQEGDVVKKGMTLARLRQSDVEQKLAEAKAGVAEARAAREQAQLDNDRVQKLAEAKTMSAAEADAARIKLDVARARVAGAEAKLVEAQTAVADATMKAPLDGIVLSRSVEVGTLAAPGVPAFVIADTQTMKVVFGVPDVTLDRLSLGSDQAVTTEAYPSRYFVGKITRISPFADPKSRVFEVEISIPNEDGALKIGMVASLSLMPTATSAKVMLPLPAILRSPKNKDGYAVLVVDEKANPPVAHLRDVTLGDFLGNMIPVLSGLEPNERVIVQGASYVADGEKVKILADEAPALGAL
jgi:multidrug efflux system membrane fusion protein